MRRGGWWCGKIRGRKKKRDGGQGRAGTRGPFFPQAPIEAAAERCVKTQLILQLQNFGARG